MGPQEITASRNHGAFIVKASYHMPKPCRVWSLEAQGKLYRFYLSRDHM